MRTECSAISFGFQEVEGRSVVAGFDRRGGGFGCWRVAVGGDGSDGRLDQTARRLLRRLARRASCRACGGDAGRLARGRDRLGI